MKKKIPTFPLLHGSIKKSIQFYADWAKGELESLFKELIEFEKKHLELLEAELDYVRKTGFWFDYYESSQED